MNKDVNTMEAYASLANSGDLNVRLYDGPDIKLFMLVGWGWSFLSVAWSTGVRLVFFFCSGLQKVIRRPVISIVGQLTKSDESAFLIHQGDYRDLFVCP